jgi:hypothetical protein
MPSIPPSVDQGFVASNVRGLAPQSASSEPVAPADRSAYRQLNAKPAVAERRHALARDVCHGYRGEPSRLARASA